MLNNMEHYKRTIPKAGEKWQHFKGHAYKIICLGSDIERRELVVVYQGVNDRTCWVRPLNMFMSEVDHDKYPNATQKWRFQKVADADE